MNLEYRENGLILKQLNESSTNCVLDFYYRNKEYFDKIKDKANGGGIKLNHLEKYIKIPNFSDLKQKRIAKEYYNIIDKNNNINLENYLDLEKKRNLNLGIFQLNMEIFDLKNNFIN